MGVVLVTGRFSIEGDLKDEQYKHQDLKPVKFKS